MTWKLPFEALNFFSVSGPLGQLLKLWVPAGQAGHSFGGAISTASPPPFPFSHHHLN